MGSSPILALMLPVSVLIGASPRAHEDADQRGVAANRSELPR